MSRQLPILGDLSSCRNCEPGECKTFTDCSQRKPYVCTKTTDTSLNYGKCMARPGRASDCSSCCDTRTCEVENDSH